MACTPRLCETSLTNSYPLSQIPLRKRFASHVLFSSPRFDTTVPGIRYGNAELLLPVHSLLSREKQEPAIVRIHDAQSLHLLKHHRHWERIKSPAADQIVPYDQLPKTVNPQNLERLAVLKVNGGLGTSMGMTGRDAAFFDFIDLMLGQAQSLHLRSRMT